MERASVFHSSIVVLLTSSFCTLLNNPSTSRITWSPGLLFGGSTEKFILSADQYRAVKLFCDQSTILVDR
ncbi:MAG TPA: hypothetical protein VIM07_13780 [Chitinophagaceae bacterium]